MTPKGNISNFFVRLVSPVILSNRIVATFMKTMFDLFEEYIVKQDNVINDDI